MSNSWQARAVGCAHIALACSLTAFTSSASLAAQTAAPSAYIAHTRAQALQAQDVQVSGDVHMGNGEMELGNGSSITAGAATVPITLNRGGDLQLCATTSIHLARDRSVQTPDDSGLMLALDRGAIEAHYQTGKYSDVLLTPDLRILISGPGAADLSIRVSRSGDTCIDNRGVNAPYITVTSQLEGGLYRVQPGQHVSFEHGSLREVIDTEHESCGCPPPVSVADAGAPSINPAKPGQPVGGPSSTPADTAFPLAVSEGLAPASLPPTTPVAAPGEVHMQVAMPFRYNGELPTVSPPADDNVTAPAANAPGPAVAAAPAPSTSAKSAPAPGTPPRHPQQSGTASATVPVTNPSVVASAPPPTPRRDANTPPHGFLHRVGHFFSRLFGAEE